MGYTWEQVMLNIDVRDEERKERQQQQDIQAMQLKEQEAAGMWSLGLSILGGALLGPVGYLVGKKAGEWGSDIAYDWESMTVDPGKFDKESAEEFNRTVAEAASDQTKGQALNTVMDLATMYVMAGGLEEGFKGMSDLTTFGTGEDAWTVFGAADKTGVLASSPTGKYSGINLPGTEHVFPLARTLPKGQTLFSEGLKGVGKRIGSVSSVRKGINTVGDLASLFLMSDEETEEETPLDRMLSSGRGIEL